LAFKKTNPPINKTTKGNFFVFTEKNYNQAELTIKFEKEVPENLEATLRKDFSILLNEPYPPPISEEEKLKEKLFEDNFLEYPNGKIINYQNKNYIIRKGFLKEIQNDNFFKIFGLNKNNLEKVKFDEEISSSIGHPFDYKKIREIFPERILIKKDGSFYLTGEENYRQIHIPEIESIIEKYNIQTVELTSEPITGKCYEKANSELEIICDFQLPKENTGNIYQIKVNNKSQIFKNFKNIQLKFY